MKPKKGYRFLKVGERIWIGDEFRMTCGVWFRVQAEGNVAEVFKGRYRRRIF